MVWAACNNGVGCVNFLQVVAVLATFVKWDMKLFSEFLDSLKATHGTGLSFENAAWECAIWSIP